MGDLTLHPVEMQEYKTKLALGHRRVTEEDLHLFKEKLEGCFDAIKHEYYFDAKSRRPVKSCNCLKNLLENASNRKLLAQVVCSHWNLSYYTRKILVEKKLSIWWNFKLKKES